ncbi:MAG TPA: cupredoxin domain-containing protein [Blastocatellia bacterium]|nr:cupredoxin domain-containing protein [Blastocatellia bacterium]
MNSFLRIALVAFLTAGLAVSTAGIGSGAPKEKVIKLTAKKFEYSPAEITVKKGEPVVIEVSSEDVKHGFTLPDFGIRTDIKPGSVNRISFTPDKAGRFAFACDVFCGAGHEEMSGTLIVTE